MKVIKINPGNKFVKYENDVLYVANNIDKEKLNEYSEFMLGSLTKLFTIYTLLILQQKKLLKIDDKVSKYIASNKNNDFSKITVFNLMDHKSGMKRMPNKITPKKYKSATQVSETFINEKLFTLKKGEHNYSNIGFILLGRIIESVTGLTYIQAYHEYIFSPLGMENTDVGETNITLYKDNKRKHTKKEFLERYFASTGGSLYSCISDMVTFAKDGISLLNKKSKDTLKTMYVFFIIEGNQIINHSGSIFGGKSKLTIQYDKKWKAKSINIDFETNKL